MANRSRQEIETLLSQRQYRIDRSLPVAELSRILDVLEVPEPLTQYTVPVLKEMMRAAGLRGFSKLRKGELIDQLRAVRQPPGGIRAPVPLLPAPVQPLPVPSFPPFMFPILQQVDGNRRSLEREARDNNINPNDFTTEDLQYLLGYKEVETLTAYVAIGMSKPIFLHLMRFPARSVERLLALKSEDVATLQTNIGYAMVTELSYNARQPLYLLWAAEVSLNADVRITPTNRADLYSTIANSKERLTAARNRAEQTGLYIQAIATQPITVYNDNDPIDKALLQFPPLTMGRWLGVVDPTYAQRIAYLQEHQAPPVGAASQSYLTTVAVIDKRPQSVPDFNPRTAYTPQELRSVAIREGLDVANLSVPEMRRQLIQAVAKPTFRQGGDAQRCENQESVYGTPFTEVPREQLYSYGTVSKYRCYERDELQQQFESQRRFSDPITGEVFTPMAVRKLEVLSLNDTSEEGQRFTHTIIRLREEQQDLDRQSSELVSVITDDLTDEAGGEKDVLLSALQSLFDAGMYMRRWVGGEAPYPLNAESTTYSSPRKISQEEVQSNVTLEIEHLVGLINRLPEARRKAFWALPLKRFANHRYYSSTSADNGLTIGDRVRIVTEAKTTSSCLRLSSTWFIFSSMYWARVLFQEDFGVDPEEIEAIA